MKRYTKGFINMCNGFFIGFLTRIYLDENGIDLLLEKNEQWK